MQAHVLEDLPTDLAMEVLRRAPGTLPCKLQQLPRHLRPLAALACCQGLPAACMLPPALYAQHVAPATDPPKVPDASNLHTPKLPEVSLCIDTSREPPPPGGSALEMSESEVVVRHDAAADLAVSADVAPADSEIWVHNESVAKHDCSLFSLQRRPGMLTCRLRARAGSVRNVAVVLPAGSCLVLGAGALDLHGVSFKGAVPPQSPLVWKHRQAYKGAADSAATHELLQLDACCVCRGRCGVRRARLPRKLRKRYVQQVHASGDRGRACISQAAAVP